VTKRTVSFTGSINFNPLILCFFAYVVKNIHEICGLAFLGHGAGLSGIYRAGEYCSFGSSGTYYRFEIYEDDIPTQLDPASGQLRQPTMTPRF